MAEHSAPSPAALALETTVKSAGIGRRYAVGEGFPIAAPGDVVAQAICVRVVDDDTAVFVVQGFTVG